VRAGAFLPGFTESGVALNVLIGYGLDSANIIVLLHDGVIYNRLSGTGEKIKMAQGFTGIGYCYYFGRTGNSAFITVGLGIQNWISLNSHYESNNIGPGILLGGGYEFVRHIQAYLNFSYGRTSDNFSDYDHRQLTCGIAAIAF
jgi:hypothetical protein